MTQSQSSKPYEPIAKDWISIFPLHQEPKFKTCARLLETESRPLNQEPELKPLQIRLPLNLWLFFHAGSLRNELFVPPR